MEASDKDPKVLSCEMHVWDNVYARTLAALIMAKDTISIVEGIGAAECKLAAAVATQAVLERRNLQTVDENYGE